MLLCTGDFPRKDLLMETFMGSSVVRESDDPRPFSKYISSPYFSLVSSRREHDALLLPSIPTLALALCPQPSRARSGVRGRENHRTSPSLTTQPTSPHCANYMPHNRWKLGHPGLLLPAASSPMPGCWQSSVSFAASCGFEERAPRVLAQLEAKEAGCTGRGFATVQDSRYGMLAMR